MQIVNLHNILARIQTYENTKQKAASQNGPIIRYYKELNFSKVSSVPWNRHGKKEIDTSSESIITGVFIFYKGIYFICKPGIECVHTSASSTM